MTMATLALVATPERALWLTGCARDALVRSRRASPTAATDHAAQAITDAQEALACIEAVRGRVPRASLADAASECRSIFTAAQDLINARSPK